MTQTLHHRGPDDGDHEVIDNNVHLGHRRLSILDLSSAGKQPMCSSDSRYTLAYNGEIYNFQELRSLLNRNWKGHSDTEVILECFVEWGIGPTLEKLTGMFALAIYDRVAKKLFLARDRFGEKPLYYGHAGETFFFGSELKSFYGHPLFRPAINRRALKCFFKFNYIPAPLSIYDGISKLLPGHYFELELDSGRTQLRQYWSILQTSFGTSSLSFKEASSRLEDLLKATIRRQMISDVPFGAFLSGGIDSSLVVALMQELSSTKVKTFTIGFNEKGFNEAPFAKEVATHLGTEHHEFYMNAYDALGVVPLLSQIYDEPFSDSSQIPTFLVSKITKQHVTVALSGDGGDEIFGGYNRYFLADKIRRNIFWAPRPARNLAAQAITNVSPSFWDRVSPVSGDKLHKLAGVLNLNSEDELYYKLLTHWDDETSPVITDEEVVKYQLFGNSFVEKMMTCDALTYLPDDILVKVDRASMAISLETRVPFLDHNVAEFGRSLPLEYKIKNGTGKFILRDILYRHVPRELIERPKMGFGVPIEHWLRSELRDWAENLLDEKKIREQGLLKFELIREKWDEHQSGKRNWQYHLWDVLMFQDWYENNFIR